jgi:hypothetical protein
MKGEMIIILSGGEYRTTGAQALLFARFDVAKSQSQTQIYALLPRIFIA